MRCCAPRFPPIGQSQKRLCGLLVIGLRTLTSVRARSTLSPSGLIGHFLPLFLDPDGPALTLADPVETIDLRKFFRDNFQTFATERKFTVCGEEFTLSGFRLQGVLAISEDLKPFLDEINLRQDCLVVRL